MFKEIKLVILLTFTFIAGLFIGVNIENVQAIVKAPNEQNQPVVSQNNQAPATPTANPEIKKAEQELEQKQDQLNQQIIDRPVSPPAADRDRGASLYSISSSMQVDIQRLEEDVAILKNKVNILSNMR
ncbi:MAG: hypothetical protein AB1782_06795 [Cyanobacteriota bacterium]